MMLGPNTLEEARFAEAERRRQPIDAPYDPGLSAIGFGFNLPGQQLTAIPQTTSERVGHNLAGAIYDATGSNRAGEIGRTIGEFGASMNPFVSAADAVTQFGRGDTLAGSLSAAGAVIPGAARVAPVAKKLTGSALDSVISKAPDINPRAVIGGNNPPPAVVTGDLNPLRNVDFTFNKKPPAEFTDEDWAAVGQHFKTDKPLGPLSPLQTLKDAQGREFAVPGGTGGEWTYYDLLHMKANPINPSTMDRELHAELQRKLGRTMTPTQLSDADVWNGLVFGMTSPNNPLFPNQATASRLRLRTPEMLDDLASSIPWKAGEEVPAATRKLAGDQIAARYGLNAAPQGGLGTRGTADYTRVAEMAQMFKKDPAFFRKRDDESWLDAVERISSQLPGLSMKTGSFGTVWQNPAEAAISAIDRHMARELDARGGIFQTPELRKAWEERGVARWNKQAMKDAAEQTKATGQPVAPDLAKDFDDMLTKRGSDGHVGEMLLNYVGQELQPKFRLASGQINPAVPDNLKTTQWVREPETVYRVGQAYKQALDVNQRIADENGLNLFMSQWMEWDRIRNRFEPHENMFPGLSKVPAMSVEQMRAVDKAHKETGHKTYTKSDEGKLQPTRPLGRSPSAMGYLGLGGVMAAPALLPQEERDTW